MPDHDRLENLDYDSAGHIGFASQDVLTVVSGILNNLILESNCFGSIITTSGTYRGDTLTVVVVDDDYATFGDVLYQATDFHYERADADNIITMPCRAIVIEPAVGSQKVLVRGQVCDTSWNWSPGTVWVSLETGELTQTKPSGNEDQIQEVGWALSTDTIFFDSVSTMMTASAGDRGVFGGAGTNNEIMDYITISTTVNAADFGDLLVGRYGNTGTSNSTNDRGIFAGGNTGANSNIIDYITINTTNNAIDFGDLLAIKDSTDATSNGTDERGVVAGGYSSSYLNTIDYITINSTGNASDFGDLTLARNWIGACSNGTDEKAQFAGGYDGSVSDIIDYITINSLGNAANFSDLTVARHALSATSNA